LNFTYFSYISILSDNAKPFVPKLITYCLKIAGILHVLDSVSTGSIDIKNSIKAGTMERAIKLTKYYAGQSINSLQLYGAKIEESVIKPLLTDMNTS